MAIITVFILFVDDLTAIVSHRNDDWTATLIVLKAIIFFIFAIELALTTWTFGISYTKVYLL